MSVVMIPVMFGTLDYGLWFNDSIGARHGAREAARQAVVQTQSCAGPSTDLAKMACAAATEADPLAGDAWGRVVVPDGWSRTKPVIVCVAVKPNALIGLIPTPGVITTKTRMSIEIGDPLPTGATASGSSSAVWPGTAAPTSWNWCS